MKATSKKGIRIEKSVSRMVIFVCDIVLNRYQCLWSGRRPCLLEYCASTRSVTLQLILIPLKSTPKKGNV